VECLQEAKDSPEEQVSLAVLDNLEELLDNQDQQAQVWIKSIDLSSVF
jgi:hypothetical protein